MLPLNIDNWRDRGGFLLPIRGGILEIAPDYSDILGSESGYVLVKARASASVYHPFIAFYKLENWLRMWIVLEMKNEKTAKDFLERSYGIDGIVNEESSVLIKIPDDFLRYAGIRKDSNAKVMRGAGSLFELWVPDELAEYGRVERLGHLL